MIKELDKKKFGNYITKAENSLEVAKLALEKKKYDAAVTNAVHSSINALDGLAVRHKGRRSTGEHDDTIVLIQGILTPNDHNEIKKQFSTLIQLKNAAEYQPDFMTPDEASKSVKWAERILAKVKDNL